jgi:hypothetical protein
MMKTASEATAGFASIERARRRAAPIFIPAARRQTNFADD